MLELKRAAMSGFIAKARAEIEQVWSELMYDESERGAFEAFFHGMFDTLFRRWHAFGSSISQDDHSEELLILHEQELERLRAELKTKARLLAAVKKYKEICEEEHELAVCIMPGTRKLYTGIYAILFTQAGANDQSRLLGRGPRDPGRLLREEKMRKRVTKEKPRVGCSTGLPCELTF
jgi:protein regulator of cytokinesis 1